MMRPLTIGGEPGAGGAGHVVAVTATIPLVSSGGVNPNISYPRTAAVVAPNTTYNVKTSDWTIELQTSSANGGSGSCTANLPAPTYIGEKHTFWWNVWSAGKVQPAVVADAGHLLIPFGGMSATAPGGLASSTAITEIGASITYEWDGNYWAPVDIGSAAPVAPGVLQTIRIGVGIVDASSVTLIPENAVITRAFFDSTPTPYTRSNAALPVSIQVGTAGSPQLCMQPPDIQAEAGGLYAVEINATQSAADTALYVTVVNAATGAGFAYIEFSLPLS